MPPLQSPEGGSIGDLLAMLNLSLNVSLGLSEVRRRYQKLISNLPARAFSYSRLILVNAMRRIKDFFALRSVISTIYYTADTYLYPFNHDFMRLVRGLIHIDIAGPQAHVIKATLIDIAVDQSARFKLLENEIDGVDDMDAAGARSVLSQVTKEVHRLEQMQEELEWMCRRCSLVTPRGTGSTPSPFTVRKQKLRTRRPHAEKILRLWHEYRKRSDLTSVLELAQWVYDSESRVGKASPPGGKEEMSLTWCHATYLA